MPGGLSYFGYGYGYGDVNVNGSVNVNVNVNGIQVREFQIVFERSWTLPKWIPLGSPSIFTDQMIIAISASLLAETFSDPVPGDMTNQKNLSIYSGFPHASSSSRCYSVRQSLRVKKKVKGTGAGCRCPNALSTCR